MRSVQIDPRTMWFLSDRSKNHVVCYQIDPRTTWFVISRSKESFIGVDYIVTKRLLCRARNPRTHRALMAPRANWEVGKAPLNIGRPPTAYDTHGCHAPERLLLQEWRDYLDTHTVGQLDRKWDRAMREQVSEKMTAFLGSTQKRSELSTGIAYMSAEERTIKTRVESLKQAGAPSPRSTVTSGPSRISLSTSTRWRR